MSVSGRLYVIFSSMVLLACPGLPDGKDKCVTQADCLSGYVCASGVCNQPGDAGSDAGSGLDGRWNLVVTAAANGNAALRSYHVTNATEETDGGITFSTSFCNLYATRIGDSVSLRAHQSCTVPKGTALSLDQESTIGGGIFGNRVEITASFCYTVWLSSSTSAPLSGTTYRFTGDGGVNPGNSGLCGAAGTQDNAALQFDLSR